MTTAAVTNVGLPDPNSQMQNIVSPQLVNLKGILNSIQGLTSIPTDTLRVIATLITELNTEMTNINKGLLVDGSGPDEDYKDVSFEGGSMPGFKNQDLLNAIADFNNDVYVNPKTSMSLMDAIRSGDLGNLQNVLIAAQNPNDGSFATWLGNEGTLIGDCN
jgi:hypothetical protein